MFPATLGKQDIYYTLLLHGSRLGKQQNPMDFLETNVCFLHRLSKSPFLNTFSYILVTPTINTNKTQSVRYCRIDCLENVRPFHIALTMFMSF